MNLLFILGTKAQFIKTIPLINLAIKEQINVTVINLNQHPKKSNKLIENIVGKYNYIDFIDNERDIGTYLGALIWIIKVILKIIFKPDSNLKNKLSIVHGDTISTLLGAILIKRNKGRVVLLEAGLGFPGMLKHFPESFVRYYVAKFSDFMIANGGEQILQLKKWKVSGEILEISNNTIYDSLDLVNLAKNSDKKVVTISIHRTENINSKENMKTLVNIILKIDPKYDIKWYLHIPTKNRLESFGLAPVLRNNGIDLRDLVPYEEFLNSLYNSDFVISDGDGVVEECFFLGVPTLVWRYEHLDSNHLFLDDSSLKLSKFNESICLKFFHNYPSYRNNRRKIAISPSKEALNHLINIR